MKKRDFLIAISLSLLLITLVAVFFLRFNLVTDEHYFETNEPQETEEQEKEKISEETVDLASGKFSLSSNVLEDARSFETAEEETESAKIPEESFDGENRTRSEELLLCIDPGHYTGANAVKTADSYGYCEGDVMLSLAQELQQLLWDCYGIDSYLTREEPHIELGGYTDAALDRGHIALRGAMAGLYQCDLFISLHSNSNGNFANGAPTLSQPDAINKPIIILNRPALTDENALRTANAVGEELAKLYQEVGIGDGLFEPVKPGDVPEWTKAYNDGVGQPGKVVKRSGSGKAAGSDYYGVLRGAASVEVPGMIIEHGFHTVKRIRESAMKGDLIHQWAFADARGIAKGLGVSLE